MAELIKAPTRKPVPERAVLTPAGEQGGHPTLSSETEYVASGLPAFSPERANCDPE